MSSSKHIILVHGFLLCGTGSNIYCCNLAMEWKRQGQAVTIFCQDPYAKDYDWVDEFVGPKDEFPAERIAGGKCRVIVPDINGLLPVYCYDEYEGYEVKTIPNMTEEEINTHINMMAKAVRKAVDMWGCDKVLSNHALLQPINVKRALEGTNVKFDIKIHGSGLLFVIKPFPKFKKYCIEAIKACNKIIVGTRHVVRQIKDAFKEEEAELNLDEKIEIVPPGMDPSTFSLCESLEANTKAFLEEVGSHIAKDPTGRVAQKINYGEVDWKASTDFHATLTDIGKTYNQRVADADLLERFPKLSADEPIIMYFGKFLNTKGCGEILLGFPTILKAVPKARLFFIGFGGFREHLEAMVYALKTGDIGLFKAAAHSKDENGVSFLGSEINVDAHFRKLEGHEADRVTITGCLNHKELGLLLPIASINVVASKGAEAFGMVTVEAMSTGVLPLALYHTGIVDVLDEVEKRNPVLEAIMHMDVKKGGDWGEAEGNDFLKVFPRQVEDALNYLYPGSNGGFNGDKKKKEVAKQLRQIATDIWSWDGICRRLTEL